MKALVTYYSQTGNTEKVAQAIFDAIERAEKDLKPLEEVEGVADYDLVFCGFPVQAHSVPPKMEPILKNMPEGKNLALFATHGSLRGGELAITAFYYALSLASKAKIVGTFGCRGKVKPSLLDALLEKPEHKAWVMEAQSAAGHPDDADLADAKEFAKWMVTKVRSL